MFADLYAIINCAMRIRGESIHRDQAQAEEEDHDRHERRNSADGFDDLAMLGIGDPARSARSVCVVGIRVREAEKEVEPGRGVPIADGVEPLRGAAVALTFLVALGAVSERDGVGGGQSAVAVEAHDALGFVDDDDPGALDRGSRRPGRAAATSRCRRCPRRLVPPRGKWSS